MCTPELPTGPPGRPGEVVTPALARSLRATCSRRSFLRWVAAAGVAAASCTAPSRPGPRRPDAATPSPIACPAVESTGGPGLWRTAIERGLVYGSSAATWQLADDDYRHLFERHAAILFTEDDLLWWRLRPRPEAELDFRFGDRIVGFARDRGMLVLGAHLVWDQGYGEGWTEGDLWDLEKERARELLFGTARAVVERYRGRVHAWIVANEVFDAFGMRPEVPWYGTIGPGYVEEAFHVAHDADPDAVLLLNDFGFETDDDFSSAADKRAVALEVVDELLDAGAPVHGFGIQAHLTGGGFAERFDPVAYRRFLGALADRGLTIVITELDVLDDGLPRDVQVRDRAVAETYRRYLEAALDEPAVASLITFGLSDRYTWLQEDFPRDDGAARRPLPFDQEMQPKPAAAALRAGLRSAAIRRTPLVPPRC